MCACVPVCVPVCVVHLLILCYDREHISGDGLVGLVWFEMRVWGLEQQNVCVRKSHLYLVKIELL